MEYRLSPSLINVYEMCPFRFYCKVTDKTKDEQIDTSYADAGTVVHHTLEYYFKNLIDVNKELAINEVKNCFESAWQDININNPKIDKDIYWLSVINAIKLNIFPTDLEYQFRIPAPLNFIGYADVISTKEDWIGDWKTAKYKASKLKIYKTQLKYYAYAYYKEYGRVPICWVFFNKSNKLFKFKYPEKTLLEVEKYLFKIRKDVEQRFKDMKFERMASRTNCYFCPYKRLCSTDFMQKKEATKMEVTFHLKKNRLSIEAKIPDLIHRKIEKEINFELKNAFFIKKAMAAKGVKYDGIKRLYKRRAFGSETFIGYSNTVYQILKDYAHSKGMRIRLTIKDYRNQEVRTKKFAFGNKLNVPFELYKFQSEAAETLIKYKWGICEIGTGGGKTAIAAECIRRLGFKTLFIIDNKDLLLQTKDDYEHMLNTQCGVVGMGAREWEKPIVLATIQTLAKYAEDFSSELAKFNLVIYDETHIIASKSFETVSKYLINTEYRFGFSATAKRDDGNDNIIYAHTGTVVYRKNASDLISEGVLVEPKALFYEYESSAISGDDWKNEYANGIVDNDARNELIRDLTFKHVAQGKQVMILCKMIKHCEKLIEMIPGSKLIYGKTDDTVRYDTLEAFKKKEFNVLIGNIKILNKGINMKTLDVLINAAGNAGDVVTVQSIGRALRKSPGKEEALYIDFIDRLGTYLKKHSMSRIDALKNEKYFVEIVNNRKI